MRMYVYNAVYRAAADARIKSAFEETDLNKSGLIDADEYIEFLNNLNMKIADDMCPAYNPENDDAD